MARGDVATGVQLTHGAARATGRNGSGEATSNPEGERCPGFCPTDM